LELGDSSNLSGEGLLTGEVGWEEAIVAWREKNEIDQCYPTVKKKSCKEHACIN
jgi:hypothetical protein